ncbi:hypothetical protein ACOMHN_047443 [Nucella lapillus]
MQKPFDLEMPSANRELLRDVRHIWTGPLTTQAYDDRLVEMSNQSKNHLYWLARNKQYQAKPQHHTTQVMNFCYLCSTMEEHQRYHLRERAKSAVSENGSVQEKRRHRILYKAPVPRSVRSKKVEEPEAVVQEALYKVTVWTGDLPGATTDAHVYLTITGDQAASQKTRLWHRQGTSSFAFVRGSREVFHVKGPKMGALRMVTIEHDGLEQRHSWHLERVEVQCMESRRVWAFPCRSWLSLHNGDATLRRDLPATLKERTLKEFEVTVETGRKRFAGTDANVSISMRGTEGNSPRLQLNADRPPGSCFKRGQADRFKVQVADVGELRSLRIEHDGEGQASSWFLNKVTLRDVSQPQCVYHFMCGGWLARDMGEGRVWKELRALRQLPSMGTSAKAVHYEVLVKTGDIHGAGTMADVYIVLQGKKGKTGRIFLSDSTTNFERSKTESFKVKGVEVGEVRSVRVGVDTSGPGSSWFLDHIKIRKNLTRQEITEKLSELKQAWRKTKQQAADTTNTEETTESIGNKTREENNDHADNWKEKNEDNTDGEDKKKEDDRDGTREEKTDDKNIGYTREGKKDDEEDNNKEEKKDDEEDNNREEKKDDTRDGRFNSPNRRGGETPRGDMHKKREAEIPRVFDANGRALRIPVSEENFFPCSKWFASDHQDGLFERELPVEKRTLCYQDR